MRIAIVSQFSSPGGGARFLRGLCLGLLSQPEIAEIGLFINVDEADRDGMLSLLPESPRLRVHRMNSRGDLMDEDVPSVRALVNRLRDWARRQAWAVRFYRTLRYGVLDGTAASDMPRITLSERVLARMGGYDIAYFPWPRQVVPPPVPAALVATFHDFNHRHRFGNYRERDIELLDAEQIEWLEGRVQPICSTRFIASELDEYYPRRSNPPEVVYLSSFAVHDPSEADVHAVLGAHSLKEGYVLCPTNISPHKNLMALLEAAGKLKREGKGIRLVLTGSGTQCLGVDPSHDPLYASVFRGAIDELNAALAREGLVPGQDVWALGYVGDSEMDALAKGAALIVAPSKYEAGSGPGLDGWYLGTPVVVSSLAPVLEQMQFLGTEAYLFDPNDVDGMAEALMTGLDDPQASAELAARSAEAIRRYTWDDVAREYLRVFRAAIDASTSTPSDPSAPVSL